MSSSQMVVNFKGADYQLFNGTIVKGCSKGCYNISLIKLPKIRYIIEYILSIFFIIND